MEIKFRAWDKITKELKPVIKLLMDGDDNEVHFFDNGVTCDWQYTTNVELMQFLGMIDKNGKELYQGDIIKWVSRNDGETEFTTVVDFDFWSGVYYSNDSLNNEIELYGYAPSNGDFEIIGNIYEI